MKTYTILLSFILFKSAFAQSRPLFNILLREELSNRIYYKQIEMPDLENENSFDGKYFKIVKAKSNDAISFNEADEKILLKAATTYYHLNKARSFWVNQMKSTRAEELPKITVRIDILNQFDELGHFSNDNRAPQYNNALSVPAGKTPEWLPVEKQDQWGNEIWFRPKKVILTSELGPMGPNPLTQTLQYIENPIINYTRGQFERTLVEHLFYPDYTSRPIHQDVIRLVGTIALTKVFIQGSRYADSLFVEKYYYLDTAMIPEIIYHEYTHLVLSDHLELSHSTPVNEGFADYFAAVMSKKRKVYAKVPGYSNSAPKDTQNKSTYNHWTESNRAATADFTLSVLWDVRETLGEEYGDQVVYEARTHLKTATATISDHLLRSVLSACETKCESPRRDKYKLFKTFQKKGF